MTDNDAIQFLTLDTPLEDALFISEFNGTEEISALFSFEVGFYSNNNNLQFDDLVGQSAVVSIVLANGERRYFNGIFSRLSQLHGGVEEVEHTHQMSYYAGTLVPWLWLLTRYTNSKIFQERSVPQIVEQIFTDRGFSGNFELRLTGTYEAREFCVQYRETDLNFVSRLLEEEGIYYFFEHEQERHNLILTDSPAELLPCPHQEIARCHPTPQGWMEGDVVTSFDRTQELRFNQFTHKDYNFVTPSLKLESGAPSQYSSSKGELYDYPGCFPTKGWGDRIATVRMQEEEARIRAMIGASVCRSFTTGTKFRLEEHDLDHLNDTDYLLTSISHKASQQVGTSGTSGGSASYANNFICIPFEVPYRPPRDTPKPVVQGTQTAVVVGPPGEEVHTNEHGQIKVQFHWDREGKMDDKSSCWIRVSQRWAGPGWGGIVIPRIGQEVIVDFLEGDPDRPIIMGCVYNANNKAPFELPASGIVSGMKSDSSPGGGGYNEISMNDTKGKEAVTIHAQYNMGTTVQNDQSITVKSGNRTVTVESGSCAETSSGDHSITSNKGAVNVHGKGKGVSITGDTDGVWITGNDRGVSVRGFDAGVQIVGWDEGVGIWGNDKGVTIEGNTKGVKITGNALGVTVIGTGKGVTIDGQKGDGVKVVGGGQDVEIGGQNIKVSGKTSIELKAGGGSIKIDASGVVISGPIVKINS